MGRPRKTDRIDDIDTEGRDHAADGSREPARDTFENDMFADVAQNPFHIPREEWPDGLAMRWISIEVTGAPDSRNWSLKTTAGWTPVQRGKYERIDRRYPYVAMPGSGSTSDQNIIFGGLCLCQRDIRLTLRDAQRQARVTEEAGRTIESYVEGGNASVPRFNQSSPIQYERGRAAAFKD